MNNFDEVMYNTFEKEYDVHYFNITEDIKKLLSKTDFKNNKVKLPFSRIRINILWEDEDGFKFPYIYVTEKEGGFTISYARKIPNSEYVDVGILDLDLDLSTKRKSKKNNLDMQSFGNIDLSNMSYDNRVELSKTLFETHKKHFGGGGYEKEVEITNRSEKQMTRFVGNFINLMNSRDIELITVERSKEQNTKRTRRGKLPIPPTTHIRLTGKIKEYVNQLNSSGHINYSHSFWVRGHWRTLRNEDRYKDNVGTMIWIVPYIKGKGNLIKKEYDVEGMAGLKENNLVSV